MKQVPSRRSVKIGGPIAELLPMGRSQTGTGALRVRTLIAAAVALPTLAAFVVTGRTVRSELRTMHDASKVQELSGAIADVVHLRVAFELERVSAEARSESARFGVPSSLVTELLGVDLNAFNAPARRDADRSMVELRSLISRDVVPRNTATTNLQKAYEELLALRTTIDDGTASPDRLIDQFDRLSDLTDEVMQQTVDTLKGMTSPAIADSVLVSSSVDLIAMFDAGFDQVREYARSMYPGLTPRRESDNMSLRYSTDRYRFVSERVLASLPVYLVPRWKALLVRGSEDFDAAMEEAIRRTEPSPDPLAAMRAKASILKIGIERSHQFAPLIDSLVNDLDTQAELAYDNGRRGAARIILLAVLLTLGTSSMAVYVITRITRALRSLEARARLVSDGNLETLDEPERSPVKSIVEASVISDALDDLTRNLRSVEAQANALANGNLDAPELTWQIPGRIGESLKASIDRLATATARLDRQAHHDELTGLVNRRAAMAHLDEALDGARCGSGGVAVLFVDLDGFKAINDRFGHAAGDELLRLVAYRVSSVVRDNDMVARFGGDEFVVIAPGCSNVEEATSLADRIRTAVCEPFAVNDLSGEKAIAEVGASVGVSWTRDGSNDAHALVRNADSGVYAAKAGGRNRVAVHL